MVSKVTTLLALAGMIATPAGATWRTATSPNFVIYTEGTEASARAEAEKLEKFEWVLRTVSGATQETNPIKVRVFLEPSLDAVHNTMAFPAGGVVGYYSDDIRGPFAVMPRADADNDSGLKSQVVLFHELSHEFMFHHAPAAYPSWYTEGFADFYGTMTIGANNVVTLGTPLTGRFNAFYDEDWLPLSKLLTAHRYGDVDNIFLLYSEGWLLVHYLSLNKERHPQLGIYLAQINAGKSFDEAAKTAFGDVAKLDRELFSYSRKQTLATLTLPFKKIEVPPIVARTLPPAESAMVPFEIRLASGVAMADVNLFVKNAEMAAKPFPDDSAALRVLVDIEFAARRTAMARQLVDHWLAVAPTDPWAMFWAARLDTQALQAAKSTDDAQWRAVRARLLAAARLAPNQPRILKAYYDTYAAAGTLATGGAQNGLVGAFNLMPESHDLRYSVARDYEQRGMLGAAIAAIRPTAYIIRSDAEKSPKERARDAKLKAKYKLMGEDDTETPREMLDRLEAKQAHADKPAAAS